MFKRIQSLLQISLFLALSLLLIPPVPLQADDWIYRIRPGETLSALRVRFLLPEFSTAQLQTFNNIEEDRAIPVGTEIRIPLDWLKQTPAGAQIVFLSGDVELYRENANLAVSLRAHDSLQMGDRIVTGPRAVLSIRFADGTRLLMGEESEITLDTLSAFGEAGMIDTRLRIQRGRVENRVVPLEDGSRYEIHTPAAVTVVRGTGYRVGVEAETGLTRNEVVEGKVAVSAAGETVAVAAGFGTLIEPGKAPNPPTKLLVPVDLSALPKRIEADSPAFAWPPLGGALHYRLMLLPLDQEDAVLVDVKVAEAAHTFSELLTGNYRIRMRGIDTQGLEGLSAEHVFEVIQPPPAPLPEPEPAPTKPGPVLETPRFGPGWMSFRWSQIADAWGYRLLLARDVTFQTPLFERIATDTWLTLPLHWQGRLYVRVDALFQNDNEESHSGIYRIELPRH